MYQMDRQYIYHWMGMNSFILLPPYITNTHL
jgi:hypothetical protein